MKKLLFSIVLVATGAAFSESAPISTDANNSETNKVSVLQRVGGFVIDYKAAKGKYLFINCQKAVDTKLVKGVANGLKGDFSWDIECVDGSAGVASTKQAIAEKNRLGGLAATIFVDAHDLPLMTVAPESNVAVINVREIAADKPKAILLENRIVREAMRGFAMSLGAGYTTFETGVMQPIQTVSDLDRFPANFMPPDCANAALQNGTKIGFKPYRRTTYKRACKEGWAPPPTNDFQKAVWDEVHQLPTKPVTIEYDPKRGK